MISPLSAINGFMRTSPVGGVAPLDGSATSSMGGSMATQGPTSFGQILSQVATGAVDSLKQGEAASIAGIQGKMPLQQVVESVMNAEQALQTALAVRDKVVAAYQEVSRMAI